jgi:hypothetical protein
MPSRLVIETQLEFYRKGGAGCLFAVHAAQNPKKYGWRLSVTATDVAQIVAIAHDALTDETISTQSIILPSVVNPDDLVRLLRKMGKMGTASKSNYGRQQAGTGFSKAMLAKKIWRSRIFCS